MQISSSNKTTQSSNLNSNNNNEDKNKEKLKLPSGIFYTSRDTRVIQQLNITFPPNQNFIQISEKNRSADTFDTLLFHPPQEESFTHVGTHSMYNIADHEMHYVFDSQKSRWIDRLPFNPADPQPIKLLVPVQHKSNTTCQSKSVIAFEKAVKDLEPFSSFMRIIDLHFQPYSSFEYLCGVFKKNHPTITELHVSCNELNNGAGCINTVFLADYRVTLNALNDHFSNIKKLLIDLSLYEWQYNPNSTSLMVAIMIMANAFPNLIELQATSKYSFHFSNSQQIAAQGPREGLLSALKQDGPHLNLTKLDTSDLPLHEEVLAFITDSYPNLEKITLSLSAACLIKKEYDKDTHQVVIHYNWEEINKRLSHLKNLQKLKTLTIDAFKNLEISIPSTHWKDLIHTLAELCTAIPSLTIIELSEHIFEYDPVHVQQPLSFKGLLESLCEQFPHLTILINSNIREN